MFSKRGFTLVEILFVVLIAAGALVLALPSYKGMRERGKFQAASGRLLDLGNAVESVTSDLAMKGESIQIGSSNAYEYTGSSDAMSSKKTLKEELGTLTGAAREQKVLKLLIPAGYLKDFQGSTGFKYYVLRNAAATGALAPCKDTGGTVIACMLKTGTLDSKDCFAGARYYKGGRMQTIRMSNCKD